MKNLTANKKSRKYITKTLTKKNINKFNSSLQRFHAEKSQYFGISLFQFYMKNIFGVFLSTHKEIDPATGDEFDFFPLQGNLDTGDPHGKPFSPFLDVLIQNLDQKEDVKRYYGAAAQKALKDSITSFLTNMDMLESTDLTVDYAIGAGTVHLYELICKQLIKRKGDAIIIPTPTYGFFIPQVYRAGGIPLFLETDNRGMIENKEITSAIEQYNTKQLTEWKKQIPNLIRLFESDLKLNWKICISESSNQALNGLENQLLNENNQVKIEKKIDDFIFSEILKSHHASFSQIKEHHEIVFPYPPRVVGALFINPTVYGAVLTQPEINNLAEAMREYRIAAIEDLAYLFVDVKPHEKQGYFFNCDCPYFSLLGVSKPFGIAGMRLGITISNREKTEELQGRIENSIGFISPIFQKALIQLFSSPIDKVKYFFHNNNENALWGYSLKRKLSIFLIEGASTEKISASEKNHCKTVILREIQSFLKRYDALDVCFFDKDLMNSDNSRESLDIKNMMPLIHKFIQEGLSNFFEIVRDAEAGFFFILNCQKFIDKKKIGPVKLTCSFDVFALLSYFFGLKLFPSEAMGIQDPLKHNQLRYSFSSDISLIVSLFFTAYVGLKQLEGINCNF